MIAPTLLRIPGNMCDARLWSLMPALGSWVMADADVTQDSSITEMAVRALTDHPGRLILLGFSMGGIVALEMARQAPERIAALILADTNAGADLPQRAALRPIQQARVRAGELATIMADELKPHYLAAQNRDDAGLKALLLDMGLSLGAEVFCRQSEALRTRADLGAVLDNFTQPILILCGAEDALCPPAWHSAMAARCRNAALHIIADAGHLLPLEQPAAFTDTLHTWLNAKHKELTA